MGKEEVLFLSQNEHGQPLRSDVAWMDELKKIPPPIGLSCLICSDIAMHSYDVPITGFFN